MKNKNFLLCVLLSISCRAAYAADAPACTPAGNVTPICGTHAPEDLELLPDGKHLLISQGAEPGNPSIGGLAVLDLATKKFEPLPIATGLKAGWGDASCTEPYQSHGTHGIHLSQRKDGIWQILVVSHATREAIESFELQHKSGHYSAIWRGCVLNNTDGMHNDVVALPDGGFIASVMFPSALMKEPNIFEAMTSDKYKGYLVEWHADTGMHKLENSDAAFNNGVQVSADGRYVYFNAWIGKQIHTYDRTTHRIVRSVDVPFYPDNLSLRSDGTLLAAGIDDLDVYRHCMAEHAVFCRASFSVTAFDQNTNRTQPFYHGEPGLIAGASVGLEIGKNLYVGSYAGDRLLQIDPSK